MILARIKAIDKLADLLASFYKKTRSNKAFNDTEKQLEHAINNAEIQNPWFTKENILYNINHWSNLLKKESIESWIGDEKPISSVKNIGVVCAGNIPLVGFHDILSAFILGHNVIVKPSSKDRVLTHFFIDFLTENSENIDKTIVSTEKLKNIDAVIATGSENTSKYFEYYFKKHPNIIRKNRSSIAIINKETTEKELEYLSDDIFTYFGMGCRSVSQLLIEEGVEMEKIHKGLSKKENVIFHNKYANNYDYHKAIYLLNLDKFFEHGFYLMKENKDLFSALATINYFHYKTDEELNATVNYLEEKTQCIVGSNSKYIDFGNSQKPNLNDYADKINTVNFLTNI